MPFYKPKPPYVNLAVRRAHPFAHDLAFATLMNDPFAPVDLVTRKAGTLTSGMNPRSNSPYGRAVSFPGTSTDRINWTGMPPPITGNGACTIAVLANPLNESRTNCLLSQRNSGGTRQISLYVNTNTGFSTSAGTIWLSQVDSVGTISGAGATSSVSGGWSWYIIVSDGGATGGSTRYYVDGVLKASVANVSSTGFAGISGETFSLGAPSNYTGGGYTHNKEIDSAFVWNRAWTAAEVRQFIADPWVWLGEPDLEVWPVSAGGGPVNGTFAASGSSTAAFTGSALASGAFSSAGTSAAAWVNGSVASGAFTALGQGGAAFTGAALARGQLSVTGSATASWSSAALAAGAFSAAGVAAANFVSTSGGIASGVFSSAGSSTAAFTGSALARGSFAAAGNSAASWSGAALAAGAFSSSGTSTVTVLSVALASGTFTVLGQGAAAFVGSGLADSSGAFNAAGSSAAAWVGRSLAAGAFNATGTSLGSFVAPFTGAGSMLDGHRMIHVNAASRIIYVGSADAFVWTQ